jgi:hypothetical protein
MIYIITTARIFYKVSSLFTHRTLKNSSIIHKNTQKSQRKKLKNSIKRPPITYPHSTTILSKPPLTDRMVGKTIERVNNYLDAMEVDSRHRLGKVKFIL